MRGILTVVMLSQQMGLRNQWVNVKVLEKVLPFILHGLPVETRTLIYLKIELDKTREQNYNV